MYRIRLLAAVLSVVAVVSASCNGAIVLDFESLQVVDNQIHDHAGVLEFQGFRITSVPPPGNAFRYRTAGTLNPLFAGSTALWNGQSNAENILTTSDGNPFSLLSIDLAVLPPGASDPAGLTDPGPFNVTFAGTRSNGSTVTSTFTINNTFLTLETFNFTDFNDVVLVSWFQGPGFSPGNQIGPFDPTHQFDNIVVAPVPEPTSCMIFTVLTTTAITLVFPRRRRPAV